EEQRVIAELVRQLGVDQLVRQVGVGVAGAVLVEVGAGEADPALGDLGAREDPVDPVERALVGGRVVLQRPADAADQGGLGRAVGAVQEEELVRHPLVHEVGPRPGDAGLHLLLADQPVAAVGPGDVEQAEAADLTPRVADLLGAVVVEAVADVLRRGAELLARPGGGQLQVLGERHHPAVLGEVVADPLAESLQVLADGHGRTLVHRHSTFTFHASSSFFGSQETSVQTANLTLPLNALSPAELAVNWMAQRPALSPKETASLTVCSAFLTVTP